MKVVILPSEHQVADYAADLIQAQLSAKPDAVLGLATGSTPVALYQELIRRHEAGVLSFFAVSTYNLDEYLGLDPAHPQSYRSFMQDKLFDHVDIKPQNTHLPPNDEAGALTAGERYEAQIRQAGGIDLQVLGIGRNGHIGFNEPTSSLASRTRVKSLTETTVTDNKRFFSPDEFQPYLAVTMGIQTILDTHSVVLLATGEGKARAVRDMIEGPLSAMCPASALQMHPKATVVLDQAAASELALQDYYLFVEDQNQALIRQAR